MEENENNTMVPEFSNVMNLGDRHAEDGVTLQGDYRQRPDNSLETNVKEGMNATIARLALAYSRKFAQEIGCDQKMTAKSVVNLLMYFFMKNFSKESSDKFQEIQDLADKAMERVKNGGQRAIKIPISKLDYSTLLAIVPELDSVLTVEVYNKRMMRFNEIQRELKMWRKEKDAYLFQLEGTLDAIEKLPNDKDKPRMGEYISGQIEDLKNKIKVMNEVCKEYILGNKENPFLLPEEEPGEEDQLNLEELNQVEEEIEKEEEAEEEELEEEEEEPKKAKRKKGPSKKKIGNVVEEASEVVDDDLVKPTWTCQDCNTVSYSSDNYREHLDVCEKRKKKEEDRFSNIEKLIKKEEKKLDSVDDDEEDELSDLEIEIRAVRKMNRDQVRKKASSLDVKGVRSMVKKDLQKEVIRVLREKYDE